HPAAPPGDARGDPAVLRLADPRGPERPRPDRRPVHVPERDARPALRDRRHDGEPARAEDPVGEGRAADPRPAVRPGAAAGGRPGRRAEDGERAGGAVDPDPAAPREAGPVGAGADPRAPAPAAPAGRPGAEGGGGAEGDAARADGAAPGEPELRVLPRPD